MEQKKTQRADLENKRLTGFLFGLVVALSLLLAALEYTTGGSDTDGDDGQLDDMAQEMDILPPPDRQDMIAAVQPQARKAPSQKVKVVEHKSQMQKLDEITRMRIVGDGDGSSTDAQGQGDGRAETDDTPQPVAVDMGDNPLNFRIVEQLPEFPGGMSAFVKWLTDRLRYPDIARQQTIKGRVVITFIVNTDGSYSDLSIAKSANPLLDKEVMRVVRTMPKWKPGLANNRPCRTMMAIPVEFSL